MLCTVNIVQLSNFNAATQNRIGHGIFGLSSQTRYYGTCFNVQYPPWVAKTVYQHQLRASWSRRMIFLQLFAGFAIT